MGEFEYKILLDKLNDILDQVSKTDNLKLMYLTIGGVLGIIGTLISNYTNNNHQYRLKLHLDLANRFSELETNTSFIISELNQAIKAKNDYLEFTKSVSSSGMKKEDIDKIIELAKENMYKLRTKINERNDKISTHISYLLCFRKQDQEKEKLYQEYWDKFNEIDYKEINDNISQGQIKAFITARDNLLNYINDKIVPKYPLSFFRRIYRKKT